MAASFGLVAGPIHQLKASVHDVAQQSTNLQIGPIKGALRSFRLLPEARVVRLC